MKNKPKSKGKKLLCPKACVLNQLDDDRHSDTIVLETKKAIASTLTMLINDGQKPSTVRHTKYKLQELAAHVDLFNPEAVKHYVATAISDKTKQPFSAETKNKFCYAADKFYENQRIQWKKPYHKVDEKKFTLSEQAPRRDAYQPQQGMIKS